MCERACVCTCHRSWRSEDNVWKLVVSLHHMDRGDPTPALRQCDKHFYPSSHLSGVLCHYECWQAPCWVPYVVRKIGVLFLENLVLLTRIKVFNKRILEIWWEGDSRVILLEFEREIKDSWAVNRKMEVRRRGGHPRVSSQRTREELEKRNAGAAWEAQ